jgi:hypothetical protein
MSVSPPRSPTGQDPYVSLHAEEPLSPPQKPLLTDALSQPQTHSDIDYSDSGQSQSSDCCQGCRIL